ncbi:hypothetical protein [Liquorilactobacillus mali]|nr:hypothetical protein [Liquorilactobacillus mali]
MMKFNGIQRASKTNKEYFVLAVSGKNRVRMKRLGQELYFALAHLFILDK